MTLYKLLQAVQITFWRPCYYVRHLCHLGKYTWRTVGEWIFHLFGRYHSKSRTFERIENFQSDCCHPWAKNSFRTRVLGSLESWTQWLRWLTAGQIDWPKSVFLQTKATHFQTMMTTVEEVNSDKTKVPDEFIFRSVLLDCFTAELDE